MNTSTETPARLSGRTLEPAQRELSTLAHLRGLVGVTRLVRSEADLPKLLEQVARVVAESLGFGTVVINLYRDAWDDFEVTTVHGNEDAARVLLGSTQGWDVWAPLLDARFERRGAYFVPQGEFDWGAAELQSFVPEVPPAANIDAWHAEDALFVPMSASDRSVLGILSVDEPVNRRRPTDDELDVLVAVAQHAAAAVEDAQEAARQARHRAALEQLAFVSSRLTATLPIDALLQSICDGIRRALGFGKVSIELLDRDTGRFRPRARAGWGSHPAFEVGTTSAEFLTLCEPQFELEGCYLLSPEEGARRVPPEHVRYRSELNGHGPKAWNHHWLVVPLSSSRGELVGFVWCDDPEDRLLPSRERLQALRMFANQTQTALEFAAQFDAVRETAEAQRAVIQASPLAILDLEIDGTVRAWNRAAERLFGWSEAEVLGRRMPIVPPSGREQFERLRAQLERGEPLEDVPLRRLRKDGTLVDVRCSATPVRDARGRVTRVVATHAPA